MAQRIALLATAGLAAFLIVFMGALGTYMVLKPPTVSTGTLTAQRNDGTTLEQLPAPPQTGTSGIQSGAPQQGEDSEDQGQTDNEQGETYAVSPDQAVSAALASTPGASLVQQPRLVSFNGTIAYEVPLDRGNVYIDATSGQVLYNGANITNPQSPQRFRRGNR
jgi:hypothetical protein